MGCGVIDSVLKKHLDEQEKIETAIDEDFEQLMNGISIDDLISEPQEVLMRLVEDYKQILLEKYYPDAVKNGLELAEEIEKDGDIKIPKSKDPNLND